MSPPHHRCQLIADFLPEHQRLLEQLVEQLSWSSHMRSRRTASMGVPYNYSGASYPVTPWHPAVAELAARVAPVVDFTPTNCLLNYYPSGQHSMGWHSDDISILAPGTGVAILSLGVTRGLRLRAGGPEEFVYEELKLTGGSLLLMSAEMQAHWRHAIRREATEAARISLSFRQIVRWPEEMPLVPER